MRLREGRNVSKATQEKSSELPYSFGSPSTIHHLHYARALTPRSLLFHCPPQNLGSHFSFEISHEARVPAITPSIQHGTGILGNAIRQEKERKVVRLRKEAINLLQTDDITAYTDNPNESADHYWN